MQKSHIYQIIREEVLRGCIFGLTLFTLSLMAMTGVAHAASSGGFFGDILEKILGIPLGTLSSYTGDGTVQNAKMLSGSEITRFQKIARPDQSCGANQCIYGFDGGGNILCR